MKKWLSILFFLGLVYVGVLQFKIYEYKEAVVPKDADYLIVLGARVKGTVPSLALKYRIIAAAECMKKHGRVIAIASGGQGSGEEISEAEAIKRGLMKRGIDEARIILENKSTTTSENLAFSKKLIPSDANKGLIVTNDFHMYRAMSMAKDDLLQVSALPAETPWIAVPKSYSREYLAITKYYLLKFF
ncbi:YdcF family protein [Neobacillus terrae]|uniref:YdcF family protein n=1 Tax=Neobacillus terrae TaxID=3034837 RepID=UPI00140CAF02|nr:YdcF family protein [Neobacillus terrae]NHM32091.1 YdcF family protein [Neobacillus terrae]